MIITCPHCQTRYEVAAQAIGDDGRSVQCASCTKSWHATATSDASPPSLLAPRRAANPRPDQSGQSGQSTPEGADDIIVSAHEEAVLDQDMSRADEAPAFDPLPSKKPAEKNRKGPFKAKFKAKSAQARFIERRSREIFDSMPMAKFRRVGSAIFLVAAALVLIVALLGRERVVAAFPDLASLYALAGFDINVVGLQFDQLRTISTLQNGNRVLVVGGRINSMVNRTVQVPAIRVTLISADGAEIYDWRVRADAAELIGGETLKFETQLAAPPQNAVTVRLSFDTMRFATPEDGGATAAASIK